MWPSMNAFGAVPDFATKLGFFVPNALEVETQIHTAPAAFGKVMSLLEPRMAVRYHFFNDHDTAPTILEKSHGTYHGTLKLAEDYMVWNVTEDNIRARKITYSGDLWASPAPQPPPPVDREKTKYVSEWITGQNLKVSEIIQRIYDLANEMYRTNENPPSSDWCDEDSGSGNSPVGRQKRSVMSAT